MEFGSLESSSRDRILADILHKNRYGAAIAWGMKSNSDISTEEIMHPGMEDCKIRQRLAESRLTPVRGGHRAGNGEPVPAIGPGIG